MQELGRRRKAAGDEDAGKVVMERGLERVAGEITEQTFGGAHLVRVDVPEVRYLERFYGEFGFVPAGVRNEEGNRRELQH